MFPPADSEIAAKRLAIIQIGADDGRFKIETLLHVQVSHRSQDRTDLFGSDYRIQPYQPSWKIKSYTEVTQEVCTQNSVLSEACGFIQWLQVEHRGAKLLTRQS